MADEDTEQHRFSIRVGTKIAETIENHRARMERWAPGANITTTAAITSLILLGEAEAKRRDREQYGGTGD